MLEIRLFGPLEARWRDTPLRLPRRQRTTLLWAYLLLREGECERAQTAFTLWPEHRESEARAELRRHLYFLSHWLAEHTGREDWLERAPRRIAWARGTECDVDVWRLRREHALLTGRDGPSRMDDGLLQPWSDASDERVDERTRRRWRGASAELREDLLPGVTAEWLGPLRDRLRRQQMELLEATVHADAAAGDLEHALRGARRLVERDPLREDSHRLLIRLLGATGDRVAALAHFERCRELLRRELDLPPAPETVALLDEIRGARGSRISDRAPRPQLPSAPMSGVAEPSPSPSPPPRGPALPPARAPIFGRERDLATLLALLGRERWVSIIGPGGIGKTRLALEIAHRRAQRAQGTVLWVDLSDAFDEEPIDRRIDRELGNGTGARMSFEEGATPSVPAPLLILDNCEHRLDEVARAVEGLLAGATGLTVLATTREATGSLSEAAWRLSPLDVEPREGDQSADARASRSQGPGVDTGHGPAVALFEHLARRALPEWRASQEDRRAIAEICRRVDGLPLGIELAAARVRPLGLSGLRAGLRESLDVLGEGPPTAPGRHRTLRATFEWSVALLDPPRRALLARLASFAGSFDLAQARAVGSAEDQDPSLAVAEVTTGLARLVDACLVVSEPGEGGRERHLRLPHTIRPYARELARASGVAEEADLRHARWMLAFAEEAAAALESPDFAPWLTRLDRLAPELRRARERLLEGGHTGLALRLAAAHWGYWNVRMLLGAERRWLETLLRATSTDTSLERASALLGAGVLAYNAGAIDVASERLEEAVSAFESLDEEDGSTRARAYLAQATFLQGDLDRTRALCAACLESMERHGTRQHAAEIHTIEGLVAQREGRLNDARHSFERSLAIQRHMRWKHHGLRNALRGLGGIALRQGRPGEAARYFEEGLALSRELSDEAGEAVWLNELGCLCMDDGAPERAREHFLAALKIYRRRGDVRRQAIVLHNVGELAMREGDYDVARRAFERSLRVADLEAADPRRVETLVFLVLACAWQGDLRRADELQREAVELAERTGSPALRAAAARAAAISEGTFAQDGAPTLHASPRLTRAWVAAAEADPEARARGLEILLWHAADAERATWASRAAVALAGGPDTPLSRAARERTAGALAVVEARSDGVAAESEAAPDEATALLLAAARDLGAPSPPEATPPPEERP